MAVDPDAPIFAKEPALTFGVVAAVVVTLASVFNVVLDLDTVETVIAAVIPIVSAFLTRQRVTPVNY